MAKMTLTEKVVRDLKLADGEDRRWIWDTRVQGLGIVLGAKGGVYVANISREGKRFQETLGPCSEMTVSEARKRMMEAKGRVAEGKETAGQIAKKTTSGPSLRDAIESYLVFMAHKGCQPSGIDRVKKELLVRAYLQDWLDRPLRSIRPIECRDRHLKIGENNGKHVANRVMANFRTVWSRIANVALLEDNTWPGNPTKAVNWYREGQPDFEARRREPLPWSTLPAWKTAVDCIPNTRRRNYQLFVMFTGLRKNDAMTVRWNEHVNLSSEPRQIEVFHAGKGRTKTIVLPPYSLLRPNPKGGTKKAFILPLPFFIVDLLQKQRAEYADAEGDRGGGWVFPAYAGKSGPCHLCTALGLGDHVEGKISHMTDSRGYRAKDSPDPVPGEGLWSPHRLRDTYATATEEVEMPEGVAKALLNHRYSKATVTEGYRRQSPELLRTWQERQCAFLLEKMTPTERHLKAVA